MQIFYFLILHFWWLYDKHNIVIGPCYCEHKKGNLSRNGLKCIYNNTYKRFDHCSSNEYCIGPDNPDDAVVFSHDKFCIKGRDCLLPLKFIMTIEILLKVLRFDSTHWMKFLFSYKVLYLAVFHLDTQTVLIVH